MARAEINVGLLVAHSPAADSDELVAFVRRVAEDARPELERVTEADWSFHEEESARLTDDDPRRPSDFLDEASLRMVEGPYDVVVVVTDVALVSRRRAVVGGLASPVSHVVVLSTRKLRLTGRGAPSRGLDDEATRWNGAALLAHLMGHVMGLRHSRDPEDAMSPFAFDPERRAVPRLARPRRRLRPLADEVEQDELVGGGVLRTLAFYARQLARHPGLVLQPLLHNRAPLLPLALPSLATAAVLPTFILIFTAEIWDVGLNLTNTVTWTSAVVSLLAATVYLSEVQSLYYPRKEKRVLTAHMAIVNASIFLTMLVAIIGLFAMVGALMLVIEFHIFPAGLIATWPTLEDPVVDVADKLRLAGFISTIGVLTGALAGGVESRIVVRHLALFLDEP